MKSIIESVALCWATRKRHIAVDGKVLCETQHKTTGYSVKNGQYNTLSLSGIPDYKKETDDQQYCHQDGIIEFLPLDKQPVKIITTSICNKCLKKYDQLFQKKKEVCVNCGHIGLKSDPQKEEKICLSCYAVHNWECKLILNK